MSASSCDSRPGLRTTVLLVNWNGWADTIECLESLFRLTHPADRVIVCDNDSTDESLERIRSWAEGRLDVLVPPSHALRPLSFPPVPKPIPWVQHDRVAAEHGGHPEDVESKLVLIRTGSNLGFAGGANVGLRYVLRRGDSAYVWLLNNDTVVHPDALDALVRRVETTTHIGICGATILDYLSPTTVQALGGGIYNRWLGTTRHVGASRRADEPPPQERVESTMSYVVGASMLVTLQFLKTVGLMRETYFLYFEEIDWAIRGRRRFSLGWAPDSIVYHKGGAATGGGWRQARTTVVADYFNFRGRLLLTRSLYPFALPTVYLGLLVSVLIRRCRGYRNRLGMTLRLALTCGGGPIESMPVTSDQQTTRQSLKGR